MKPTWRERRKLELHGQLYQAALTLFETHGYQATTVQQITDELGVAKGTFFNHFPSKEHVLYEWYNSITSDSLQAARERADATVKQTVCDLFTDMARQATASPELLIAKWTHNANPLLVAAEHTQEHQVSAFLHERCTAGKARGELTADLDVAFFVGLLTAVLAGSSRDWIRTQPRPDLPALIVRRVHFVFRAATPTRG